MDEHHEGIAFTRCILLLFKKRMYQLWGIRNEEVKVPREQESLDYNVITTTLQTQKFAS